MNKERDHPQVRRLLFWAGSSAPLDRYCYFLPTTRIHLDTAGWVWQHCAAQRPGRALFPPGLGGFCALDLDQRVFRSCGLLPDARHPGVIRLSIDYSNLR